MELIDTMIETARRCIETANRELNNNNTLDKCNWIVTVNGIATIGVGSDDLTCINHDAYSPTRFTVDSAKIAMKSKISNKFGEPATLETVSTKTYFENMLKSGEKLLAQCNR